MKPLQKTKNHYFLKVSMLKKIIIQASFLIISLQAISGEKPEKKDTNSWTLVQRDNEISVYDRWIELPDGKWTRERKGVFYVKSNIEEIIELVSTAEGIKSWMSGVKESSNVGGNIVYILFNIPWPFKDKELLIEISTLKNNDFPGKKVQYNSVADYMPLNKDNDRLQNYEATWTLTMIEPGYIQVSFAAFSDTPLILPKWIQDPITIKIFEDNLLKLRELLIELNNNNLNALKR